MRWRSIVLSLIAVALFVSFSSPLLAEVHIGGPVKKHGLAISSVYLKGVKMSPDPAVKRGADVVHMECDLAATENNKQGFTKGDWVPYVTCAYQIEKAFGKWSTSGVMLPMVAKDGPHYANNIKLAGAGTHKVTYYLYPPSQNGFYRHADSKTGVQKWWEPFKVSWTFEYPSNSTNRSE